MRFHWILLAGFFSICNAQVIRTKVAILGGGMAGVTAASVLSKNSVTDFLIIEAEPVLGGRMKETTFGGYTIELGANWIQGVRNEETGEENPLWTLAKKYNLTTMLSDSDDVLTYDQNGWFNYTDVISRAENTLDQVIDDQADRSKSKLEDLSFGQGQRLRGWKPQTPYENVADWWLFDFEYADRPDSTSMQHVWVNTEGTYEQWSHENALVIDGRGFATLAREEAKAFVTSNNTLYNSVVSTVKYTADLVNITLKNGRTILADYAICTFSLGVLQNNDVKFEPPFPAWKQESIFKFKMATYTKIFLQFPYKFWNDSQFILYADPYRRGYYPQWQSLSEVGFLPNSNILFVTVVTDQSYVVEAQTNNQTLTEIMTVLKSMYKINIPEPTNFYYNRWTLNPLYRGSYSNWPTGTSQCQHDNFRRPIGRLHFAGEAYSQKYNGFVHGAYFEGLDTGKTVADRVLGKTTAPTEKDYVCRDTSSASSRAQFGAWIIVLCIAAMNKF